MDGVAFGHLFGARAYFRALLVRAEPRITPMTRLPAVFVSHGSPMIAIEDDPWGRALAEFAAKLPKPRAAMVVSGHWEEPGPVRVTASPSPETMHDFGGFPEELYRIRYPARGDPGLAALTARLLEDAGFPAKTDPERGLDHGAWVPLRFLYPDADVPVVEISQPLRRNPEDALRMGAALSRLRDQDVLLLGTGGVVHNLRKIDLADERDRVADWARAFDSWIAERLEAMDAAGIASYRTTAPHAELAVPTPDHLDPIFVVLGSAIAGERVTTIHEGFRYGTLSMRSFAVGSPRPKAPRVSGLL
jgi:4,5-DOPA dioxygenase extradiol